MSRRTLAALFVTFITVTLSFFPYAQVAASSDNKDLEKTRLSDRLDKLPTVKSNLIHSSEGADKWWLTTTMDLDRDKIVDNLENYLATGRPAAVFVDLDHHPDPQDTGMLLDLGVEVVGQYRIVDAMGVRSATAFQVQAITRLPGVVMVEPSGNSLMNMDVATPNAKARESAEYSPFSAWESGYTGKGIVITVMDTGQDNGHPALEGKWVGGADISKPETRLWPRDGTFNADDTQGHGTTCAGIATSTGAPDGKYMGSAPDAHLVDLRIGTKLGYAPGEGPQNYYDATLQGLDWAIAFADKEWSGADPQYYGMDVLSLSWGNDVGGSSDGKDVYSRAVDALATKTKVIPVIAAGNAGPSNDGFDGLGAADWAITIAATDDLNTIDRSDDKIADYSSRGPRKDDGDDNPYEELKPNIAASGTNIYGVQFNPYGDAQGNGYGNRGSGTSYATPLVSGVVALMLQANSNLTTALVREILQFTAERRGPATYPELDPFWNRDFGYGIVDAYNATRVAAEITDVKEIDINLQAFIMNITEGDGDFLVDGIAWHRAGALDWVEVSVDNGTWKKASDQANETWAKWSYTIPKDGLSQGNHTIKVRAVAAEKHSLEDHDHFYNAHTVSKVVLSGSISIMAIILVAAVAVIVFVIIRRRKMKNKSA